MRKRRKEGREEMEMENEEEYISRKMEAGLETQMEGTNLES